MDITTIVSIKISGGEGAYVPRVATLYVLKFPLLTCSANPAHKSERNLLELLKGHVHEFAKQCIAMIEHMQKTY